MRDLKASAMLLLSFCFDDGRVSQGRELYPILRKHGFHATFYVIGNRICSPGSLNLDDLATLESEGNEIGSHGLTHRPLTKLTPAQIENEANCSLKALSKFQVRSFAYPFGLYDDQVVKIVSRYYDSARSYGLNPMEYNKPRELQRYRLRSFSIEGRGQRFIETGLSDSVLFKPPGALTEAWLIFTLHGKASLTPSSIVAALRRLNPSRDQIQSYLMDVRERLSASERKNAVSFNLRLDSFCQRIKDLNIPVLTVSEALEQFCD